MVGIYSGSNQIKNVYAGSQLIKKVYYGSTLVYEIMAKGTKVLNKTAAGTGSFTVTVPGKYILRCVGGGGSMAIVLNNSSSGLQRISSGGGGGAAQGCWQLSAGDVLTWKVGGAVTGWQTPPGGGSGGQSYIKKGSTTLVSANGGTQGGYPMNGDHGSGGTASCNSSALSDKVTQTGGAGANYQYNTYAAAISGGGPPGGTSKWTSYGKGSSGYYKTASEFVAVNGTAGMVQIEWNE